MSEREKQPEPGETRPSEAGCRPELVRTELQRRTRREVSEQTRVDELGLSSIDQVELLLELEQQCQVVADETEFADAETIGDLEKMVERMLSDEAHQFAIGRGAIRFPEWNRKWPARAVRRANLSIWILPFTQLTARPTVTGLEHLNRVKPPVLFASNHLSNLDTPVILAALPDQWRYRIAPAIYKERFRPHFFPQEHSIRQRIRNSIDYYLIALLFNAFPIPQREPGARQTLRYAGDLVSDGWSLLIFPEGRRRPGEQISEFMPGVGLLASRLSLPVVPIHLRQVDQVLPPGRLIPRLGATQVSFGPPIAVSEPQPERLTQQVEEAVKAL